MKTKKQRKQPMNALKHLFALSLISVLAFTACTTPPPNASFLSTYDKLKQTDANNWRYCNRNSLAKYDKFMISPAKIMVNRFESRQITLAERNRAATFIHDAVFLALSDRYQIVTEPGPDVAEIRIALTAATHTRGSEIGLSVEGEILSPSRDQIAAALRSDSSQVYLGNLESNSAGREIVEDWARRMRQTIDQAHAR